MVIAAVALLPKSEAMAPGITVMTWMPNGCSSMRSASEIACSAALEAQYTPENGVVVTPDTLPILMIRPLAVRQQLGAVANQLQRGKDVGVELAQQGLAIGIHDWPHGTVPGVVDQKVQAPPACSRICSTHCLRWGGVIHIEFDGDGALVSQRGQGVDTAHGGEYLIACVQAGQRQSLTDAGRTAGDQGDGLGHGVGLLIVLR